MFHQVKGIPMGINPAVYFANKYLFVYEYLFLRDAIQVYNSGNHIVRRDVLNVFRAFKFTKRFVDDLSVLTKTEPRFLDNYLFNDQVDANGVHGIYPRPLVLHSTTVESGRILRSLDVEVFPENSVTGPLFTRLYDKRRQPCFAQAMTLMRFPAIDYKLSVTCKLNVFDSQFVRRARIITDVGNFVTEIADLITDMVRAGYGKGALLRRCRRRISRTPFMFGVANGLPVHGQPHRRGLYKSIKDRVRNRVAS